MQIQSSPFIRSIWHMAWVCGVKTVGPVTVTNMTYIVWSNMTKQLEKGNSMKLHVWLPGWEWGIACISFREDWSSWKSCLFERKVCFEENSKWRKIYLDANGRGLYREMRHDPRNPGKKEFWFYDLRFESYGAKRKTGRYSATMRPTDLIIFQLILVNVMNLLTNSWTLRPYGFRGKNSWMWLFAFSIISGWGN